MRETFIDVLAMVCSGGMIHMSTEGWWYGILGVLLFICMYFHLYYTIRHIVEMELLKSDSEHLNVMVKIRDILSKDSMGDAGCGGRCKCEDTCE